MKNERTPRTLADCQFTTGYSAGGYVQPMSRTARRIYWTVLLGSKAACGVMLGLGF